MYIKLENVSLLLDNVLILKNINITLSENSLYGLVGNNGTGKTTLLKFLSGQIRHYIGKIYYYNQNLKTYYLNQLDIIEDKDSMPVFEYLYSTINPELYNIYKLINTNNIESLIYEYIEKNGYKIEEDIEKICNLVHLDTQAKIKYLSPGQKQRLCLASIFSTEADIYLLDEPTNHLDTEGIEIFQSLIRQKQNKIILIATHDRNILSIVNKILHFENKLITQYDCNYIIFRKQLIKKKIHEERERIRKIKKIHQLNEAINIKEEILDKKKKIRDNNKIAFKSKLERQSKKLNQQKIQFIKRINKIRKTLHIPKEYWGMRIQFVHTPIISDTVLDVQDLAIGYEKPLAENISFTLNKNDRLLIQGRNGSGKTTLLRTIVGEISPIRGTIKVGEGIKIGYFFQENKFINIKKTVLEDFMSINRTLSEDEARDFLRFYEFDEEKIYEPIFTLSEGEKMKLRLAKLFFSGANFLILDEPTNNLDFISQEALQKSLNDFEGPIILVSHDNLLINNIQINKKISP